MSVTIPMLPCRAVDEVVAFYESLGFQKTYGQVNPNPYVVVRRDDIELHFFGLDDFDPARSLGNCIVQVADADAVFRSFTEGLRAARGRVPWSGLPRLTRPRKRADAVHIHGFSVIDPGGNWIRISEPPPDDPPPGARGLLRKLEAAMVRGEDHGDQRAAAEILDSALARHASAPVRERVPALVYRAELAIAMDERALAAARLADVRALSLDGDDRAALAQELARAAELEHDLG
jgi:hypothetical protein